MPLYVALGFGTVGPVTIYFSLTANGVSAFLSLVGATVYIVGVLLSAEVRGRL